MRFGIIFCAFIALTQFSEAKPVYFQILSSEIPKAQLTNKCQTCHLNGPQLNPFGKDFFKIKRGLGADFSQKFWLPLSTLDSDQDGINNYDEIMVGRNPGKADK